MSDHDPLARDLGVAMRAALDATAALARISSHEAECVRRYADIAVAISRFHSRMDELLTAQERGREEELGRRERRDRDTRQTAAMARIAAMSSLIGGVIAIGLHFWR